MVRVIDTSSLIKFKDLSAVGEQWPLLVKMSGLVDCGRLAFPRQVVSELKVARHPDAPGVWAASHRGWSFHPQPRDESVAEALGAAQLTDPDAEPKAEPADPYIVAMALEIQEKHPRADVAVVTEDRVDRMPAKESIVTACNRLGLTCCDTANFLAWVRAEPDPSTSGLAAG